MIKVISSAGKAIDISFMTFSGGEEHVNIKDEIPEFATIYAQITSSSWLLRLLLVTDALRGARLSLFMPYLPYARQDRACVNGDAFSLKVFADIINAQHYESVIVCDPHSDVSIKLINNIVVVPQDISLRGVSSRVDVDCIISPDAGAKQKTAIWHSKWPKPTKLFSATKKRNEFGQIISSNLDCDSLEGFSCLIVDDICDGGRTFFELSKMLKQKGAEKVYLFVTHGIFSNGIAAVGVDKVFTTDSLPEKDDGRIIVKRFLNV